MKKIIWFSNCVLSCKKNTTSGSWLYSMANLLTQEKDIYLINITIGDSKVKEINKVDIFPNFIEYILPKWKLNKKGCPSSENCLQLEKLCKTINPDIVHIWGIERYYASIIHQFGLNAPILLEIQGLLRPCAEVYYGDLSLKDILSCFKLREILFPQKSIIASKKNMFLRAKKSEEIIPRFKFISTQSQWVRDNLASIAYNSHFFKTGISLRGEFWDCKKWQYTDQKNFYCTSSDAISYKSIQTAIKALRIVVKKYPLTKLYIIGNFKTSNWLHQSGYLYFLLNLISKYKLNNNIVFTGPLKADEIISIMYKCIGMIQTSYVESYSLALAEAQAVGIPSIISYAGAMPELAEDYVTGLFYSPGDYRICASKMIELIENETLANSISEESYKLSRLRNNSQSVLEQQIKIYDCVLNH